MRQSSIDFLVQKLAENGIIHSFDINEAKKMHKQEIIKAYKEGSKEGVRYYFDTEWGYDTKHIRGDEYYKNTYEKE